MASNEDRLKEAEKEIEFLMGRVSGLSGNHLATISILIAVNAVQGIGIRELISDLIKKSLKRMEDEELKQNRSEDFIQGHKKEIEHILSFLENLRDAENKMLSESKKKKTSVQITITPDGKIITQ